MFPASPPQIQIKASQITLKYADKPFDISYGRMPFLSALMEFLMTTLGYSELDDTLAPLIAAFPTANKVSETSNALSRNLYGYLGDHLPTVQDQRRHRSFLNFIAERSCGESADRVIDDASIFDYWFERPSGPDNDTETDSRTYRSVFRTAIRLLRILRLAEDKQGIAVALPIGTDREAGEVNPSELEAAITEIEIIASPITTFEETNSNGVKIFNKRELETLRLCLLGEETARTLTRSILRNATFGDAQARLSQALRQGLSPDEISSKIADEPTAGYLAYINNFASLAKHVERMLLISFHVLYRAGHHEAINAALVLRPQIDLSSLGQNLNGADSKVVSFEAASAVRDFFKENDTGPINELAADAAKAGKSITRQGFSEGNFLDPKIIEIFASSVSELALIHQELNIFLEKYALGIDWKALEESDTPLFRKQFARLYGDENG
tara:strand:- start:145 stop:1473 length:1329 start_codon:yes stop_codon:yes gene_type:complete